MSLSFRGVAAALALCVAAPALAQDLDDSKDNVAGPYVPTPWVIVEEMLKLADIRDEDVVYDLGSGDGRLVITAAKRFGARGVGEIGLVPTAPCIAGALYKYDGVVRTRLPMRESPAALAITKPNVRRK